jgi:hypothetical protein
MGSSGSSGIGSSVLITRNSWRPTLTVLDDEPIRKRQARITSLKRAIEGIEARQERQIRSLELDDDPDGIMFRRIRDRLRELEDERLQKIREMAELKAPVPGSAPQAVELLSELPMVDFEPQLVPETSLRRLFEAFRLEVRYDKLENHATCRATLSDESVETLAQTDLMGQFSKPRSPRDASTGDPKCAHVVRAPGAG